VPSAHLGAKLYIAERLCFLGDDVDYLVLLRRRKQRKKLRLVELVDVVSDELLGVFQQGHIIAPFQRSYP